MLDTEFRIRARLGEISFDPDEINIFAYQKRGGNRSVARKLEFIQSDPCEEVQPFLKITKHEAQKLMDDLWDCGLRPSEGTGSAGAMRATEKHLEDMKTVAFHALKISKKEN